MLLPAELETAARELEASPDYRVLRRMVPRSVVQRPLRAGERKAVVLDVETTGLDAAVDEVIELGMVAFAYDRKDRITDVIGDFSAFNEPSGKIPADVADLTGITDAMVKGHRIEASVVERFVADAGILLAHNAMFDRAFVTRLSPIFETKPWSCTATEIEWKRHGFSAARLGAILAECGIFHGAHRAVDDCNAVVELMARPLPGTSVPALHSLLSRARQPSWRILAERAPYQTKDILKRRGYRWSANGAGGARCWQIDVGEAALPAELDFLRSEVYRSPVHIPVARLTARERFSTDAETRARDDGPVAVGIPAPDAASFGRSRPT